MEKRVTVWDGASQSYVEITLRIAINWDELALALGRRAYASENKSRGKSASLVYGAIKATIQ